ncbi:hypothetical protein N7495_008487 [Penicillium taxi]|uniref:uncharacterized protein n=1 Tax=Penicillium taxi TaxID=168475 RepID=UPI0025456B87|nr:uncharacterized protein N7495_008487 [Penicillium taxi]KAJ5888446.1 hypothetical protein N7495_008487 [Penicillium taxi]
MDNEIPLPPPRRVRHRSPARAAGHSPAGSFASSFKTSRFSRFDDRSSQPSSDPALFSSDDIPASGLENYNASGAGRKRRYRGTWWGEQVVDPKRKRADFKDKRHVDSGVWMGSDESGASLLPSEDASNWGEDLLKSVLDPNVAGKFPLQGTSASTASPVPPTPVMKGLHESEEHRYARAVVNECLEKGKESIDLGNLNLNSIPSGLLQPLRHFTKLPSVHEAPISDNFYTSLRPFLSIYLSGNSLTSLHNELFELGDLKVLSVRNNKLNEIPANIRKLTGLEVLNIAVNDLSFLPYELLGLLHAELKHFTAYPNPFPSIEEAQIAQWHRNPTKKEGEETPLHDLLYFDEYDGEPPVDAGAAIHVATGPTVKLDVEGRKMEDNLRSPSTIMASNDYLSNAPSLRELSLRAVCKLPDIEHVTDEELAVFPKPVATLLRQAKKVRAAGGQHCSVCQQEYVIPRAEWLEWWDCAPHENGMRPRVSGEKLRPLPFRRFCCSWACAPGSS